MPRLFTGLELPDHVANAIASLRGGIVGARWIDPADYHITLRFIGDVDHRAARDAVETLSEIRRPAAPSIRLDRLDAFGGARPRAIVLRIAPDPTLLDLQAEQERRLRRIGLEPETRKYLPHVTLARLRGSPFARGRRLSRLARRGCSRSCSLPSASLLYSARDSVGGGPYIVEAAFPLG